MKKISIILSIIIFGLVISACNKKDVQNKNDLDNTEHVVENEEVESIEVKTIVIDPGHSSIGNSEKEAIAPDSNETKAKDVLGATGVSTKVPEHITTVEVSKHLKYELIKKGYNVITTKSIPEESLSNIERAQIGNENNADLVIRIHADSCENQSVRGASVLIPPKNKYTSEISDVSRDYGEKIISTYTEELGIKNRGIIYRDDMTGFNWSNVPVVILEMGFLSNVEEDEYISNPENHEKIARAIAKSI